MRRVVAVVVRSTERAEATPRAAETAAPFAGSVLSVVGLDTLSGEYDAMAGVSPSSPGTILSASSPVLTPYAPN